MSEGKTPDMQTVSYTWLLFHRLSYIAKGAPNRMWVPVSVIAGETYAIRAIYHFTLTLPCPMCSGPILDACGYLVGVNVSNRPTEAWYPGEILDWPFSPAEFNTHGLESA